MINFSGFLYIFKIPFSNLALLSCIFQLFICILFGFIWVFIHVIFNFIDHSYNHFFEFFLWTFLLFTFLNVYYGGFTDFWRCFSASFFSHLVFLP
jgi:hypothetical protein